MIKAGSGEGREPTVKKGIKVFESNDLGKGFVYVPVYIFSNITEWGKASSAGAILYDSVCACVAFKREKDILPRCKAIAKQFGGEVVVYKLPLIDWTDKDKKGGSK